MACMQQSIFKQCTYLYATALQAAVLPVRFHNQVLMQNVLEYTGSKADRQIIRKHEFHYAKSSTRQLKFDVLLVCSHTLRLDSLKTPSFIA